MAGHNLTMAQSRWKHNVTITLAIVALSTMYVIVTRPPGPPPQTTVLVPYNTDNQEIIRDAISRTLLFCRGIADGHPPREMMEFTLADLDTTAATNGWDSDDRVQVLAGMVYHALPECEEQMLPVLP